MLLPREGKALRENACTGVTKGVLTHHGVHVISEKSLPPTLHVQPVSLKPEYGTLFGQRGSADVIKLTDPDTGRHLDNHGGPHLSPLKEKQRILLPLRSERRSRRGSREVPGRGAPPTAGQGYPGIMRRNSFRSLVLSKDSSPADSQSGTGAQSFSLKARSQPT